MTQELTALPTSFAAGTTIVYRKSFSDYPASDGWTLTLYLAGASVAEAEAEVDGDDFVVTIAATDTGGDFSPGLYQWAERVSKSGEMVQVASGVVDILPDLTQAREASEQHWIERTIVALRAHVEGRAEAGMESYQIAGRAVSKIPLREAIRLLTELEARLERMKNPGAISRTVYVEFPPLGYKT
jgi:hypothetical protein